MSENKSVNATAVSVNAAKAKTKAAEKAAHELAERKMAELAYAENYRQKLREEKAAKKSAEIKEAELKAAEQREAEAKERRKQMEELLQKEREEMVQRNAKANAVLQKVETEQEEAKKAPKPQPEIQKAPAPEAPKAVVSEPKAEPAPVLVKEAPVVVEKKAPAAPKTVAKPITAPGTVKAPIGSFIPFAPKKKTAPKAQAPAAPVMPAVKKAYTPNLVNYSLFVGRPSDSVTLEDLFRSYQTEVIEPDLHSKEVIELLDAQKKKDAEETDALYDRFLELFNEQKGADSSLQNAKLIRSLSEGEQESALDAETLATITAKLENMKQSNDAGIAAICDSLLTLIRGQKAVSEGNLRGAVEEEEQKETQTVSEYADTLVAETENEPAEEIEEVKAQTVEEEDALWVEEDMEKDSFALIPDDLKDLAKKVVAKYVRDDLKLIAEDVNEQRKHQKLGKKATDVEKRKAAYEAVALCRMTIENYAILLKLSKENDLKTKAVAKCIEKEIAEEGKLVAKLNKATGREFTPVSETLVKDILNGNEIVAPKELYRKETVKA